MEMNDFLKVNLGHVISILTFLGVAAMGWQKMKDQQATIDKEVEELRKEQDAISKLGLMTTVAQHERRLVAVEETARLTLTMQADLRWIKEKIDRMQNEVR